MSSAPVTLEDHIARYVAQGGRILVCPPAHGFAAPPETPRHSGDRKPPMSARVIAAIPAAPTEPVKPPKAPRPRIARPTSKPKRPPAKPGPKPGPKPSAIPIRVVRAADLAGEGKTRDEIAAALGIAKETVKSYLAHARKAGITIARANGPDPTLTARIVAAWTADPDPTIRKIAAALGIWRKTVSRHLKIAGISRPPAHRPRRTKRGM